MKADRVLSFWIVLIVLFTTGCNGLPVTGESSLEHATPTVNLTELMKQIPTIQFPVGSTRLTIKARKQIRNIAKLINQPGVVEQPITVNGHTDTLGDAKKNMVLSRKRADSVIRELVLNGVRSSRLTSIARGESQPIAVEHVGDSSQERDVSSLNRRVEILLGGVKTAEVQ